MSYGIRIESEAKFNCKKKVIFIGKYNLECRTISIY